jgi:hypothetical protein
MELMRNSGDFFSTNPMSIIGADSFVVNDRCYNPAYPPDTSYQLGMY